MSPKAEAGNPDGSGMLAELSNVVESPFFGGVFFNQAK